MAGVLDPCLYDLPKEGTDVAHSKLNSDFDIEECRDLSAHFSNPQLATVVPAIVARRLFLAEEVPLLERNLCVNKGSERTKNCG